MALLVFGPPAVEVSAQTVVSSGHIDIGISYDSGGWNLHLHREEPEPGAEYGPDEVVLQLGLASRLQGGVPDHPAAVRYFGPAGSPLWVLSTSEVEGVPFLGIGAEGLSAADWDGALKLGMTALEGPGDVFIWNVDPFGGLLPLASSRDGVTAGDGFPLEAGRHTHLFWGFSAPGDYRVTLQAAGQHRTQGEVSSDPATYRFQVIPEPRFPVLLGLGALVLRCIGPRGCRQSNPIRRP